MSAFASSTPPTAHVHTRGRISDVERACAQATVAAVLDRRRLAGPARVRLSGANCDGGPALIQINLRVGGTPARVQVSGRSVARTIAAGATRLEHQIQRLSVPGEPWPPHGCERRCLAVPGRGDVARLKTFRLLTGTPDQAAASMNAMDYDVYLYTDADTGEDAIVYRAGPTGLRLARQRSTRPPSTPAISPLTINPHRPPQLTPAGAADLVAVDWLPYLFFTDAGSQRGNLLYRRYDGELGLITPAVTEPSSTPGCVTQLTSC